MNARALTVIALGWSLAFSCGAPVGPGDGGAAGGSAGGAAGGTAGGSAGGTAGGSAGGSAGGAAGGSAGGAAGGSAGGAAGGGSSCAAVYTDCDGGYVDLRSADAGIYFEAPPVPKCIRVRPGQVVSFTNVFSNFHYPEQRCGPVAGAFSRTDDGPVTAPSTQGVYGYDCGLHGSSYAGSVQVLP